MGEKKNYNWKEHGTCKSEHVMGVLSAGILMYRMVHDEKFKHYIGENVIINRVIKYPEAERTVGGCVIGIYPHFLLLDCGSYKTTISYKDLILGGKK